MFFGGSDDCSVGKCYVRCFEDIQAFVFDEKF
jgi:hypothetical protein